MRKKLISIVLAVVLCFSLMGTVCAETDPCAAFRDVNRKAWYHTALDYVVKNKMMSGTSAVSFDPSGKVSRAMVVQTFYAIADKPSFSGKSAFADVKEGAWYFESVNWAADKKLAAGYGEGAFKPNINVSREQLAVFFKAFSGYMKKNIDSSGTIAGYFDQGSVSSYARDAMRWAVAVGIIAGKGNRTLAPKDTATRAELAQMLYRFMNLPENSSKPQTTETTPAPSPSTTVTPSPSQTAAPSVTPKPSETAKPSETPKPSEIQQTTPRFPLQGVVVNPSSVTLKVGEQKQLRVTYLPENTDEEIEYFWMTTDVKVASIDRSGLVTAQGPGEAILGINVNNKFVGKCEVTVKEDNPKPEEDYEVSFKRSVVDVEVGGEASVEIETNSPSGTTITIESSSPEIADSDGSYVYGFRTGYTVLTAKVGNKSATCSVYVNGYVNADAAYTALNEFRTSSNVWQWNQDNTTKTIFNSNSGNQLKSLEKNAKLEETAKIRAKEIVQSFSHTRPDGSDTYTAYPSGLRAAGENIAFGYSTAKAVTEAWEETDKNYNGQGHRRNMLDPDFKQVGIAGYMYRGRMYWVQSFGTF